MDERVIPYGFPELPGGAQGGASIDPTPPTPTPGQVDPYDFKDLAVALKGIADNCDTVANVHVAKSASDKVKVLCFDVSGIVPVDLIGINSAKIVYKAADFSITADGTDMTSHVLSASDGTQTKTILQFQDGVLLDTSSYFYITATDWNTNFKDKQIVATFDLTVDVYDLNGVIVQTASVVATI